MSNSEVVVHFIALILVKYLVILRYQPIRLMQETYSPFILLCATNSGQNYIAYIPLSPLITTKKGGLFSYSAIFYEGSLQYVIFIDCNIGNTHCSCMSWSCLQFLYSHKNRRKPFWNELQSSVQAEEAICCLLYTSRCV